jgi:hypothetical protein
MPFCLENYIPLFNGLVDYFGFIKRRLMQTQAYRMPGQAGKISYMIENNSFNETDFTLLKRKKIEVPEDVEKSNKRTKKGRYSSRGVLNSAYENLRSGRTHFILKHEQYLEGINNDVLIVKKLNKEQKEQFERHQEFVRLEEEKGLKLVEISVIEQTKLIMTIIRNFISNKFNEKIVYNEKKLLNILYDILLYNNESELDKLALENFSIISR